MNKPLSFGLAGLVVGLMTGTALAGPETFAEAKAQAAELDKPLLIDFYATW